VLADALISKAQGERPVSLVGYSLGGRVIYSCLLALAERKAFGLIDSVVVMGAPMPSDAADWRTLRSVVSGRFVNVFSENDYILAFLYRTSSVQLGIAGIQAVEGVHGIESVNVGDMVNGHLKYQHMVGPILSKIGWADIDEAELGRQQAISQQLAEAEKREKNVANHEDEPNDEKPEEEERRK
jgi:pimeloyl-ACP methyl ester carboxylesterase